MLILGAGSGSLGLISELALWGMRDLKVTLVDSDAHLPSNPALFQTVLSGKRSIQSLEFRSRAWYETEGITLLLGRDVREIDHMERVVTLDGDEKVAYDLLVLSAKGTLAPLEISRTASTAVVHLRGTSDLVRLKELAGRSSHVVVLGGDPLGVETSLTLAQLGLTVELLCEESHLLFGQLDPDPAVFVKAALEKANISVRLDVQVDRIEADGAGDAPQLTSPCEVRSSEITGPLRVLLKKTPEVLCTEVVVVTANVDKERGLGWELAVATLERAGVSQKPDSLSRDGVYFFNQGEQGSKSGDVNQAASWEQGRLLARLFSGRDDPRLPTLASPWRISNKKLQLVVFGGTKMSKISQGDLVELTNAVRGTYKALRVEQGRMVGAVFVGDDEAGGALCSAQAMPHIPLDLQSLLFGGLRPQSSLPSFDVNSVVCICNNVTKGAIEAAIGDTAGPTDIGGLKDAVAKATGATTGCGSCREVVERLVDDVYEVDAELRSILGNPALHGASR